MPKIQLFSYLTFLCTCSLGFISLENVHAQVLTSQDTVVIVDADGKTLGPVLGPVGYAANSAFYTEPFVVPVTVTKGRVSGDFSAWFESTNCSGNPVIDADEVTGIPFDAQMVTPATIFLPNQNVLGKLYIADSNAIPHLVTVRSKTADPGCIENENFQAMVLGFNS